MAFKKAPEQDTYSTVEFPIVKEMNSRDHSQSKDYNLINVVPQVRINKITGEHELSLQKRCGLGGEIIATNIPGATGEVLAMYYSRDGVDPTYSGGAGLFIVIGRGLYVVGMTPGASFLAVTTISSTFFSTAWSKVSIDEFIYDTGSRSYIFVGGNGLSNEIIEYNVNTATTTTVTDAQRPTPTWPIVTCMDGYVLIPKAQTGDVYFSDLNNPQSWTAGNFFTTEMYNDNVVQIGKIKNYVVVFGTKSIEFFYNRGDATGSPFQRNPALSQRVGLISQWMVQDSDCIYFLGNTETGNSGAGVGVYRLTLDGLEKISDQALEQRLLAQQSRSAVGDSFFANCKLATFMMPSTGQTLLSIYLPATGGFNSSFYTGISSVSEDCWAIDLRTRLTLKLTFFPIYAMTIVNPMSSVTMIARPSKKLNILDPSVNTDEGSNFTFTIVTANEDFGTMNRKTMSRLTLLGENPGATASVNVSWTDDDYQNYNTPIAVNMNQDLPSLQRLGMFRRRALKITGTHNQPFTLERIEVDINKGGT